MATPPPVLTPNQLDFTQMVRDPLNLNIVKGVKMDTTDIVSEFKKGYKTTEFWQAQIANLLPLGTFAAALFGFDVDTELLLASLGGLLPNLSYIFGRTWLKRKRLDTVSPYEVE